MFGFDADTTRRGFLKAGVGAVTATTMTETTLAYEGEDEQTAVVIKRDTYGVPHVYAPQADGKAPVFFGYGYVAAEDRLFQLEMYRRFYHGTVSEVLGSGTDTEWVTFDRQARVNRSGTDLPKQIETHLEDVHRDILEAFADGINRYIETVSSSSDREFHKGFTDNGFTPDAWTREDVAGMFVASMSFFSGSQLETLGARILSMLEEQHDEERAMALFSDIQWGDDPSAPTSSTPAAAGYTPPYTPAGDTESESDGRDEPTGGSSRTRSPNSGEHRLPADPEGAHAAMIDHWRTIAEGLDDLGLPIKLGSNALAVSGDQSRRGDALLFGGPQMGFNSPSVMHEIGLHGPDFDVAGITVAGYPFVMFGHNNHGAMSSTAGVDNSIQTFVETIRETDQDDGYEYKFRGEWYPVESQTETIPVKDGENVETTIRWTRHGVVINWDPENDEALTMTRSYEGMDMRALKAYVDAQFATDVQEFKQAALQCDYSLNFFWADDTGDIGYFHLGRYPDWERVEWDTRLPADGTKYELTEADYLRAADEEVPFAINPSRGYTANWNNKPAPNWNSGDMSYYWGVDHRVQRIINLVDHRLEDEGDLSYEFMKDVVYDIAFVDLRAIRFKEPLLAALEGADLSETEQAAADALRAWDNFRQGSGEDHMGAYPIGYTVFNAFYPTLRAKTFKPVYGNAYEAGKETFFNRSVLMRALYPDKAALTPAVDYFDGDRESVFRSAFQAAVADLREQFGTDDVSQWQSEARVDELDNLALFGMPIGVGDAGNMPYLNRGTENHFVRLRGDQQGSGPGFHAENILPPGNSGYIAPDGTKDNHYSDQLDQFIDFEYKQLRFSKSEVARGTETLLKLRLD